MPNITPEQLKALELAHDAVREKVDELVDWLDMYRPASLVQESNTALDTLTAAIEAIKESK